MSNALQCAPFTLSDTPLGPVCVCAAQVLLDQTVALDSIQVVETKYGTHLIKVTARGEVDKGGFRLI